MIGGAATPTRDIPTRIGQLGESSAEKSQTQPPISPLGRTTRRISAKARDRSGTKLIASTEATTSNDASETGSFRASATWNLARRSSTDWRAWSICALAQSTPTTVVGQQVSKTVFVKMPVPQPTSSHFIFAGTDSQRRNS